MFSGNKVEVIIDRDSGISGSWFPATIIRWFSSDILLVQYDDMDVKPTVVGLHQLRPVPTPVSDDWEVKIGDKVEGFQKHRWWEGHVSADLGNGRFRVCCTNSEEMVFPKELLRVHRQWINHNWVPPITHHQINNHKELRRELKRQSRENKRNRICELPDCILLHILSFLEAQDAVRTCILSKRWKDLCKCLTTLTYTRSLLTSSKYSFEQFMSWVLSSRDHSCSLLNLTISAWIEGAEEDLYELIKINPLLSLKIFGYAKCPKSELLPLIFGSRSLTFLDLSYLSDSRYAKCPKSLHLPALRTLHLRFIYFVPTHNHRADPFPNCHVLNTLVLTSCSLIEDTQVLCISNQTLSNLTIRNVSADQYSLSTPNLSSFTISDCPIFLKSLSSTCNLSFLQQVNMYNYSNDGEASIFLRWLQVLANVNILEFGYDIIEKIQAEFLLNPTSKNFQPPRFVRLELFMVYTALFEDKEQEIMEVVKHLLQNTTSMPRVVII